MKTAGLKVPNETHVAEHYVPADLSSSKFLSVASEFPDGLGPSLASCLSEMGSHADPPSTSSDVDGATTKPEVLADSFTFGGNPGSMATADQGVGSDASMAEAMGSQSLGKAEPFESQGLCDPSRTTWTTSVVHGEQPSAACRDVLTAETSEDDRERLGSRTTPTTRSLRGGAQEEDRAIGGSERWLAKEELCALMHVEFKDGDVVNELKEKLKGPLEALKSNQKTVAVPPAQSVPTPKALQPPAPGLSVLPGWPSGSPPPRAWPDARPPVEIQIASDDKERAHVQDLTEEAESGWMSDLHRMSDMHWEPEGFALQHCVLNEMAVVLPM